MSKKREQKRAPLREAYNRKKLNRQLVEYKYQLALINALVSYLKPLEKYTHAGRDFQV